MSNEERRIVRLSEEQLEYIIKGVKKQAMDEIYADIGKGVVRRILWVLGLIAAGLLGYLAAKGHIQIK